MNGSSGSLNSNSHHQQHLASLNALNALHGAPPNGTFSQHQNQQTSNGYESNIISKRFNSANSLGPFSTTMTDLNPYEKWSNGGCDSVFSDHYTIGRNTHPTL